MPYRSEDEVNRNPKCPKRSIRIKCFCGKEKASRHNPWTIRRARRGKKCPRPSSQVEVRDRNSSTCPLQPLGWHLTPGGRAAGSSQVEWTERKGGDKNLALWIQMESTDVSRQAWCDYLDQARKSKMPKIMFQIGPWRRRRGGGRRRTGVCLFLWGKSRLRGNFHIKDTIKKIMTCYSVTTKDNKRNGIELWQGKTGLNMRKTFLTAEVIKHRKGKLEENRKVLWRSLKK